MAKDVINVGGEDRTVREDTAKSYRGTVWALITVAAFVLIAAIMFIYLSAKSVTDKNPNQNPQQIDQKRQ